MEYARKRKAVRFPLDIEARLEAVDADGSPITVEGRTRDVSSAGAFVLSPRRLGVNVRVHVDLFLFAERLKRFMTRPSVKVSLSGEVLRADPEGMAVRFNRKFDIEPAIATGAKATVETKGEARTALPTGGASAPKDSVGRRKEKQS